MKMKILSLIIAATMSFASVSFGDDIGGYAGPYLQYSVTPRATGMGNAYTAVSDDIAAVFFNPGAVAQLQKLTVGGAYRDLSLQRSLQQLAVSFPVRGEAAIALSAEMASMGDIIGRNTRGEPTGTLDNVDAVFGVTFSRRFSRFLTAGGDVRYYYKKLVNTKANSAGFDFGTMIHLTRKGGLPIDGKLDLVRFAVVVRNIGAKYPWNTGDYWSQEGQLGTSVTEKIPVAVKLGASVLLLNSKLLLAVDGEKDEKKAIKGYAGVEYKIVEEVALRTGLSQGKPTFGAGFKVPVQKVDARIDIAVQQAINIGGWESIFGFSVGI
jgi:hypothetical protein